MDNSEAVQSRGSGGARVSRRRALGLIAGAAGWGLAPGRALAAAHEVLAWPAGKAVPALSLTDLDEHAWSLTALRGRAVVLNFWASWCDPCRAEMPSLQRLAEGQRRAGLEVLAVNYKEARPAIRRFLQANSLALPVLLDPDGAASAAWTPRVFPTTVLIGRDGIPRWSVVGELDWGGAAARELIEPLLAAAMRT